MEFLEGESLRGLLRRDGVLPEELAKDLALQMGQTLLAAHQKGIIHRTTRKTRACFRVSARTHATENKSYGDSSFATTTRSYHY